MAATYGMRAGQHIKLTKEGTEQLMKGQVHALQMEQALLGLPIGHPGIDYSTVMLGADRQLMFAARMYRCAHCRTRYESLPNLMGAVKCRNCGSPEIGEES